LVFAVCFVGLPAPFRKIFERLSRTVNTSIAPLCHYAETDNPYHERRKLVGGGIELKRFEKRVSYLIIKRENDATITPNSPNYGTRRYTELFGSFLNLIILAAHQTGEMFR